ncbi:uncharacterized protein LOC111917980 [Lactuca sativa]|uniref:DUF3741 domain-containing protein n=1 Tax=Lactuca sativa TaxID=4236 RepID=A0A9R1UK29_LACSA|nr:uncharacterized protein LOC111917980 [Lactuca sativa]KAJ0188594.1 hypothetical protein LSAT_V11C900462920 [Lactuca sativa]
MKFFRSEAQLSNFKHATGCCLPGVLRRLSCFRGLAATQHHRIKESTELRCTSYNPGIVAKLMGLESIPQRITSVHRQQDHRNSNSRSQSISKTPMVLELEKRKFFILGLEAGCKGKGDSRSDSRRKLLEHDGSKKKSNGVLKEGANVDFDLEFFDQMVLELVYIF